MPLIYEDWDTNWDAKFAAAIADVAEIPAYESRIAALEASLARNLNPFDLLRYDSYGDVDAAFNRALMNSHYASGFLTNKNPPRVRGGAVCLDDTVLMGPRGSQSIEGAGNDFVWEAEAAYGAGDFLGGNPTRFLWKRTDYDRPMFDTAGAIGPRFRSMGGQGKFHLTSSPLLIKDAGGVRSYPLTLAESPILNPNADPWANEDRCREFIRINSTVGVGSGKVKFSEGVTAQLFQCGVHVADTEETGHGDQWHIPDRFCPQYCDVGVWLEQQQAVEMSIRQMELANTTCGVLIDKGGRGLTVDILSSGLSAVGIYDRANDAGSSVFGRKANYITVDHSTSAAWQALRIDPTVFDNSFINVADWFLGWLTVSEARATAVSPQPLVYAKNFAGRVTCYKGKQLYDGMIEVAKTTNDEYQHYDIHECDFYRGKHDKDAQWKVLTTQSTFPIRVGISLRGNREMFSVTGATNSGRAYAPVEFEGFIQNNGAGVVSFTPV